MSILQAILAKWILIILQSPCYNHHGWLGVKNYLSIYLSSSYWSKIGFTVHDAHHLLSDEDWNKIKWNKPEKQNIQLYINLVIFVGSSKKTSTKANKIPVHATHSYILRSSVCQLQNMDPKMSQISIHYKRSWKSPACWHALGRWRQSGFISIGTLSSGEKTSAFWTPGAFVAVPWQSTRRGSIIYTLRVCLGLSKCPLAVSRETENGTLRMCLACELDFL